MLNTIAREHRQFSVVPFDGHCDVMFALRREEQALDPITELHRARRLADVIVGLFERAHRCHGVTFMLPIGKRQAAKLQTLGDGRKRIGQ